MGKREALDAFCRIAPDEALLSQMLESLKLHSVSRRWKVGDGRYVPNPKTWLEGERWTDELSEEELAEAKEAEENNEVYARAEKGFRTHRDD